MTKVELLMPAGSIDALRAAVNNGADAVYLGLSFFNARQFAKNFTASNIASVVQYCHEQGVKIYITLNTLIKNQEMKAFFNQASIAYQAGVDAFIIQDEFLAPELRKNFPGVEIHLSTQAHVTNRNSIPDDVDRVILARELSIDEIALISKDHTTEIFVHGALCVCYSGQCLFSSMVGGRSGNRGMCAQPCRKKYNERYALSTKDLCLLSKIPELIESGVHSLKVEGRMKSPLYVGTVARIYRKAIDSYYAGNFSYSDQDMLDLKQVFNRTFTSGHAFDDTIIDSRKQSNRGLFIGQLIGNQIQLMQDVFLGDEIVLWEDGDMELIPISKIISNGESVDIGLKGTEVEVNNLSSKEKVDVYRVKSSELAVNLGDELPIQESELFPSDISLPEYKTLLPSEKNNLFSVRVHSLNDAEELFGKADILYYDFFAEDFDAYLDFSRNNTSLSNSTKLFAFTPSVLSDVEIDHIVTILNHSSLSGVMVSNKGLLHRMLREKANGSFNEFEIHGYYTLNVFNDMDMKFYSDHDIIPIISPELSFDSLKKFKDKMFMVFSHGVLELMTIKQPIKGKALTDEEKREFPLVKEHGYYKILNNKSIGLFDLVKDLKDIGISYYYFDLRSDALDVLLQYKDILAGKKVSINYKNFTKGHFDKDVI